LSTPGISASVGAVVEALVSTDSKHATKYLSPQHTVKATVIGVRPRKRDKRLYLVVTIGAPNYREREFIKRCAREGVALITQQVQLRPFPAAKRKRKAKS